MTSISQATNAMSNATKDGVELNKVLASLLTDLKAANTAIGVLNARLDAIGAQGAGSVSTIATAAGTTNVSGNTPGVTTTS